MKTPDEIAQLLFRHSCQELSPEEELELAEWRRASAENEQVFQKVNDPEYIRTELRFIYENKDRIYNNIMAQYPFTDTAHKTGGPRIYRLLRMAAAVVITLGVTIYVLSIDIDGTDESSGNGIGYHAQLTKPNGITVAVGDMKRGYADGKAKALHDKAVSKGLFLMAKNDPQARADHYNTLYTEKGEQYGIQLPDSTRIWLNEKSSVKYPANYSADSGRISVAGEVYVEAAENKPFLISLQNLRLAYNRGLFNIRAYSGDSVIITVIDGDVTLDTGSVHAATAVLLHPSEQAQIIHGRLTVLKNIDILKAIAWRHHAGKE